MLCWGVEYQDDLWISLASGQGKVSLKMISMNDWTEQNRDRRDSPIG